jgi:hypothetical protein
MSESPEITEDPTVAEDTAATTEPEMPHVETAFLIVKAHDGSWRVTTDVTSPFVLDRAATRPDVRIGTSEIHNLVNQQDLAALVAATIKATA